MKVKELIEELQKLDQDLNVRLECDHGQYAMTANGVGETYVDDDTVHMADEIHPDDFVDGEHDKVVIIQAY